MTHRVTLLSIGMAWALGFAATAVAADPIGLTSELERTANATPDQKRSYAGDAKGEISDAAKQIGRMLETAKKGGADTTTIQCLTSRLTAVRALQSVCENATMELDGAISGGAVEKADHEFRRVAVALSKSRTLLAEAQRCNLDEAAASGDTIVILDVEGLMDEVGVVVEIEPTDWNDIPLVTVYF